MDVCYSKHKIVITAMGRWTADNSDKNIAEVILQCQRNLIAYPAGCVLGK